MPHKTLESYGIDVIYEDERIIALNKPAGMLTLPDRFDRMAKSIVRILESVYPSIFVVHRIDKETSGLIIFAKDAEAHKFLNEQFMEHSLTKVYHAVVRGVFNHDELEIDIPIMANPNGKGGMVPSARGKYAITVVRPKEKFRLATLLECNLITGRQHQIRVHCSTTGYPLLIDEMYSGVKEFYLSSIKRKFNLQKNETEKPVINRLTLHSKYMKFIHPDGAEMKLESEYPKDFDVLIKLLRKYA
ncbi:MAG: RNA pseudouridine synthase [Candidatus Kapabacteria bacterium]|nr:RNA pseudouridine synthase [Ignavibacteriota bacterium]MCW5885338.1 RNA pseudouridine synthase [Candidatus Kapabacteria bacterium]